MTVLNKHKHGIPEGAVYIGRGSKWGNPFVMGRDGDRDRVCEQHENYVKHQLQEGHITLQDLASLHGKNLVCYCAPARCHGHTLERMAAWAVEQLAETKEEFKLIVAGGRDFNDYGRASDEIMRLVNGELAEVAVALVSGMARGADALAVHFAREHNAKLYEFPADWDRYGKAAGFKRNEEMGRFADGLLAFWDGQSRGTKHMIEFMRSLNKSVQVITY